MAVNILDITNKTRQIVHVLVFRLVIIYNEIKVWFKVDMIITRDHIIIAMAGHEIRIVSLVVSRTTRSTFKLSRTFFSSPNFGKKKFKIN